MATLICLQCKISFKAKNSDIKRRGTKFCGQKCYHLSHKGKSNTWSKTHGMTNTRIFKKWQAIFNRINSKRSNGYMNYGGRGITFCDRWKQFENFYEDMNLSYIEHVERHGEKNTTLNRIDVNGNYEPLNCNWETLLEQQHNTRKTTHITYNGETLSTYYWAKRMKIKQRIIQNRFTRLHWSPEKTLTEPIRTWNGKRR